MIFISSKVFIALAAVVSVATASTVSQKRQEDLASCDFVFQPDAPVDPSTDFDTEFNFVIGRSLSIETGGGTFNAGSTATENADDTFNVHDDIGADGKTAEETAAILTGWVGETKEGIAANWLVLSVTCA
ncbi:hypothetical protein K435DRAFT_972390 [Dendrothele bispora CBS 962.96]|uniref:Uncharacterized protein n=1 Tax=Dendrothele bispora (strain CBS 962.96) TaxID=1314807 RepID=A0A4V4HC07_DENBC|nr:hypothetical protein K435DRAFT_972390 [Dendrothele bispora CBS 962.96]